MMNVHRIAIATLLALGIAPRVNAAEDAAMNGFESWVENHQGTAWSGVSELWVDPAGNDAEVSDATLRVGSDGLVYTWAYKGKAQTGEIKWNDTGLQWQDSWHQPDSVPLAAVPGHGALLAVEYSYPAGSGPDWHWRIKLAERPNGSLVLQMINIAPWGEEARAVRMVLSGAE